MTTGALFDLKEIFCLLRMNPSCFSEQVLLEIAGLCVPGEENGRKIRRILRCQEQEYPYQPRWMYSGTDGEAEADLCENEEDCALLRSVLYTAAELCRQGKMMELKQMADAAHNLPAAMVQKGEWLRRTREELQDFFREADATLLPADPSGKRITK